jgi:hypothetical protein
VTHVGLVTDRIGHDHMFGWFADVYIEYLFRVIVRAIRVVRSRDWPVSRATVLSAECPRADYGCTVAAVYYEYMVDGRKYGGGFEKPFIVQESGERFAGAFIKGAEFAVRVDPRNSSVTVPRR